MDCVLTGEGETAIAGLLDALKQNQRDLKQVPGCVTLNHRSPPSAFVRSLDDLLPARHLARHRRKYFIGELDPAASIEFSRGCPCDCVFCSAWTFYGRNYRVKTPECAVEELAQIRDPAFLSWTMLHSSRPSTACRSPRRLRVAEFENVITSNTWRRVVAQQGDVQTLETAGSKHHVPRR